MKSITVLLLFSFNLIFLFSCSFPPLSDREKIIAPACDFLWKKQSPDGGWHSETHGIMKSGQSVSAFVFYNLLQVPDSIYRASEKQKNAALDFLRKRVKNGILGDFDPIVLDYPNYATAYALRVFRHFDLPEDQKLIGQMNDYLLRQQFTEPRKIFPDHLAYGAWGFGEKNLEDGKHGHVDLSHTRRILESLQLIDNQSIEVFRKAQFFLSILQKNKEDKRLYPTGVSTQNIPYDGGFFASSVTVSTNKGGLSETDSTYYKSYATATADGILGLMACGVAPADARVQDAFQWLLAHPILEYPEGIPHDDFNQWHQVMFYYHLAVRAQAYRALNHRGGWEEEIVNLLLERQLKDGSFSNPMGAANKENDPLIATSLALQALL